MKKQSLKTLQLQKRIVSNFDPSTIKGGYTHSNAKPGTREYCCYPL
ncbi:MAG: hypothetical protein AAF617_14995 [Bacteroidota bacterium]